MSCRDININLIWCYEPPVTYYVYTWDTLIIFSPRFLDELRDSLRLDGLLRIYPSSLNEFIAATLNEIFLFIIAVIYWAWCHFWYFEMSSMQVNLCVRLSEQIVCSVTFSCLYRALISIRFLFPLPNAPLWSRVSQLHNSIFPLCAKHSLNKCWLLAMFNFTACQPTYQHFNVKRWNFFFTWNYHNRSIIGTYTILLIILISSENRLLFLIANSKRFFLPRKRLAKIVW